MPVETSGREVKGYNLPLGRGNVRKSQNFRHVRVGSLTSLLRAEAIIRARDHFDPSRGRVDTLPVAIPALALQPDSLLRQNPDQGDHGLARSGQVVALARLCRVASSLQTEYGNQRSIAHSMSAVMVQVLE